MLEPEVYGRMFYPVLLYRAWCHLWSCCRSQYEPYICQFCKMLQIKDKNIIKEINKKLKLDSRNFFPPELYYGVMTDGVLPLFVYVDFGPDRQRPCSENNYGVLHYEVINSPFMLFKSCLDILGRIIFNQCDKYLMPALLKGETFSCSRSTICRHSRYNSNKKKMIRKYVLTYAVKLIKHCVVQTCQSVNPRFIRECYENYNYWDHYHNPYLSIDLPDKDRIKMNSFCLIDALQSKFNIDPHVFVSKKKKIVHLSLGKPLINYSNFKSIIRFIKKLLGR